MNTLEYKGYTGKAEVDFEAKIIHGVVTNTRDIITFQADTIDEAIQAFKDSVDEYIAMVSMD